MEGAEAIEPDLLPIRLRRNETNRRRTMSLTRIRTRSSRFARLLGTILLGGLLLATGAAWAQVEEEEEMMQPGQPNPVEKSLSGRVRPAEFRPAEFRPAEFHRAAMKLGTGAIKAVEEAALKEIATQR